MNIVKNNVVAVIRRKNDLSRTYVDIEIYRQPRLYYIKPNAKEIRFVRGRISFEGVNTFGVMVGKGSAPMHDSMIIVFDGRQKMST